jgi:hypothetical protein
MAVKHLHRKIRLPFRCLNRATNHEPHTEVRSEIGSRGIEWHVQHRGSGQNVHIWQIAEVRDQRVSESETKAARIGGIANKKEWEHSERTLTTPSIGLFRAYGCHRCSWKIAVRKTGTDDTHRADESIALADHSFQEAGFR